MSVPFELNPPQGWSVWLLRILAELWCISVRLLYIWTGQGRKAKSEWLPICHSFAPRIASIDEPRLQVFRKYSIILVRVHRFYRVHRSHATQCFWRDAPLCEAWRRGGTGHVCSRSTRTAVPRPQALQWHEPSAVLVFRRQGLDRDSPQYVFYVAAKQCRLPHTYHADSSSVADLAKKNTISVQSTR